MSNNANTKTLQLMLAGYLLNTGLAMAITEAPESLQIDRIRATEGMKVVRPETEPMSTQDKQLRWDKSGKTLIEQDRSTKVIRLISGSNLAPQQKINMKLNSDNVRAQITDAALAFIDANPTIFTEDRFSYRVDPATIHIGKDEQFLMVDVYFDDVQIFDAQISFRFKFGKLVQVENMSFTESLLPAALDFDATALLQKLKSKLVKNAEQTQDLYRVVVDPLGYRLVRVREFRFMRGDVPMRVQLSAHDGEVFQLVSEFVYNEGVVKAEVYPRSWLDALQFMPLPLVNVTVGSSTRKSSAEGTFDATGSSTAKLNGLVGTRANISTSSGSKLVATGSIDENGVMQLRYKVDRSVDKKTNKTLSQANVYVHVNRIIERASVYIQPAWFNTSLRANVNLKQTCNAYWNGSTINFYSAGRGCANTGLLADVVYHEWGHGLDANTGGIADGAFSEGFGDIMSLIMTQSPKVAVGFFTDGRGIRNLETDKIYPRDTGEVHDEGLIIGSTFYDVYEKLVTAYGKDAAVEQLAKYAFKMIYTARRYTDVYQALLVIDDNDADLSNGTPNLCLLNTAFTAHGLAKKNASCP